MKRLPALTVVLIVAITATIAAVFIQYLVGKSAATIAVGPLSAIALALIVSRFKMHGR